MKRLMKALFFSLFAALLCAACAFEPAAESLHDEFAFESAGTVHQANHTACFISQYSHQSGYSRLFHVKAMNAGKAACPFKASIDVYQNGAYLGSTPVISLSSLAPFSPGPPPVVRSFAQSFPVSGACEYDLWFKYKPNYPSGSEQWFRMADGPFPC
jgi:hypothetical protein